MRLPKAAEMRICPTVANTNAQLHFFSAGPALACGGSGVAKLSTPKS